MSTVTTQHLWFTPVTASVNGGHETRPTLALIRSRPTLFGMTEPQVGSAGNKYLVQSVARCLRLLDLLGLHAAEGLSLTEAAKLLATSKSATFALLQTLIADDFVVEATPGPRYRLGPAILRLADCQTRSVPLIDAVRPAMQALTAETGWTSRLAVSEHGYPVFVDRVDGSGTIRFFTPLGRRELPHHSAAGKAMLAAATDEQVRAIVAETGLPERTRHTITDIATLLEDLVIIRQRGYSIDDEEDDDGVLCIGAAFAGNDRACAGAVSITGLKNNVPSWRVQELGRLVRAHADRMAEVIGGRRGHPGSSQSRV